MSCSHTKDCQLYPQFAADPSLKLWQQHYCESNFEACARYQIALSGKQIPLTLLPNGKLLQRYRKRDEMNAAALFNAIQKDRIHVVKSLLNGKLTKTVLQMADGTTPLMAAAERGNRDIVQLLLEAGCSPAHKNQAGEQAIDIARRKGHVDCVEAISPFMKQHITAALERESASKSEAGMMAEVLSFLRRLGPAR
ncbi:MAG: ankyrin repeat domain-containing protein [Gammaproteobacteria bacterium]|nr:ankyrin repeat domain-containing protein [Gammaproteobacteria bacterium]